MNADVSALNSAGWTRSKETRRRLARLESMRGQLTADFIALCLVGSPDIELLKSLAVQIGTVERTLELITEENPPSDE
tara:strand:- start:1748 stop:1981 length:234 start_codon:yes stop_codon:yes gene_type:complete